MTRIQIGVSLGLLAAFCVTAGQSQESKTEMIPVKYDGLKQEVLKQRGKVLVLDFWAGW